MTNTQETITDIIAEMRTLSNPISDGIIAINGRSIADRLEAAWKREKTAIEADALAAGGMVEASRATAEKSSVAGNTAKLREALEHVEKLAREFAVGNYYVNDFPKMLLDAIQPALAAPARNCDRFNNLKSAQRYYIEHGCPKGLGFCVDGEIRKFPWKSQFEAWLFAPATEQKGENNANK